MGFGRIGIEGPAGSARAGSHPSSFVGDTGWSVPGGWQRVFTRKVSSPSFKGKLGPGLKGRDLAMRTSASDGMATQENIQKTLENALTWLTLHAGTSL